MARKTINTLETDKEFKKLAAKANAANAEAKKVLFQMNIAEKDKKAVKAFCAQNSVSMTDGLLKCFYYVKSQVESGKAEMTRGGVFELSR